MLFEQIAIDENTYNIRFYHHYKDTDGNPIKLEVYQRGYDGLADQLKVTSGSLRLTVNSGELDSSVVKGMGCKFTVINDTGDFEFFNELFGTDRYKNYLMVKKEVSGNDIYLFEGFVLPEIYSQNIKEKSRIEISASNQLKQLEDTKPFSLKSPDVNYVKLIDVLKEVVWQTKVYYPIYICDRIYNPEYTNSFDINTTLYDEAYVDKGVFFDDGELLDAYEILEMILKMTYSRIYWDDRKWIIQRTKDIEEVTYKVYHYDGSTSTTSIHRNPINLENQKKLMRANNIQYIAGCGKYEMDLNVKLRENLINNDFADIQRNYGLPGVNEWFINSWNTHIINKKYSDTHITRGIHYNPNSSTNPEYVKLSTKFTIDYNKTTSLNIRFRNTRNVVNYPTLDFRYKIRFSLKVVNDSQQERYIYHYNSADDENWSGHWNVSETRISTGVKYYESEFSYSNVRSRGGLMEVNETIDLSNVMNALKLFLGAEDTMQFIIDIFPPRLIIEGQENIQILDTRFGDLKISADVDLDDNNYKVELDDVKSEKTKKVQLDLYDYSTINVVNSLLFKNGDEYRLARWWKEDRLDGKKSMQAMLLASLIQQYNKDRYMVELEIIPENHINHISIGNVLNFNVLKYQDESLRDFVIIGCDHNVEKNVYKLKLQEFTSEDGYYLLEDSELENPEYLTITPSSITVFSETDSGAHTINVDTNVHWQITDISYSGGIEGWATVNTMHGYKEVSIPVLLNVHKESDYIINGWSEENIPNYRDVHITFETENHSQVLFIRQHIHWDLDDPNEEH